MNTNSEQPNPAERTSAAAGNGRKSPIVTRRRALHMAFHQAISALSGARNKAAGGIIGTAVRVKKAGTPPAQGPEE